MTVYFNRSNRAVDIDEGFSDMEMEILKAYFAREDRKLEEADWNVSKEKSNRLDALYSSLKDVTSGQDVKLIREEPSREERSRLASVTVRGKTVVFSGEDKEFLKYTDVASARPKIDNVVDVVFTIFNYVE